MKPRGGVDDETDALDLALVVESDDTDERVGVFLLVRLDLTYHLGRIGTPIHGQLPHGPVPPIVVPWGVVVLTVHMSFPNRELNARNPSLAKEVINFLSQ